ncbi:hypothetical protein L914_21231, partial [Phytophthora nicotianae]
HLKRLTHHHQPLFGFRSIKTTSISLSKLVHLGSFEIQVFNALIRDTLIYGSTPVGLPGPSNVDVMVSDPFIVSVNIK